MLLSVICFLDGTTVILTLYSSQVREYLTTLFWKYFFAIETHTVSTAKIFMRTEVLHISLSGSSEFYQEEEK